MLWSDQLITKDIFVGNDYKSIFDHPGHIIGDNELDKIKGPPEGLFKMSEEIVNQFNARDWDAKFKYRPKKELGTEQETATSNQALYESLTQQGLRLSADNKALKPGDSYGTWNPVTDGKLADRNTPWPGEGKKHYRLSSPLGETKLWKPTSKETFDNYSNALSLADITLKRLI